MTTDENTTPAEPATMSAKQAAELADQLRFYGDGQTVAENVKLLESRAWLAGRLIRAMLNQSHHSDVFRLPA